MAGQEVLPFFMPGSELLEKQFLCHADKKEDSVEAACPEHSI